MNWDIVQGNWKQVKGEVQSTWGRLTEDEVSRAEGDRVRLAGLIQEHYGVARDEAERQIDQFADRLKARL